MSVLETIKIVQSTERFKDACRDTAGRIYEHQLKDRLRGLTQEESYTTSATLTFNRGLFRDWVMGVFETWVRRHSRGVEA